LFVIPLLSGLLAGQQEIDSKAEPATTEYTDSSGKVGIRLPAQWVTAHIDKRYAGTHEQWLMEVEVMSFQAIKTEGDNDRVDSRESKQAPDKPCLIRIVLQEVGGACWNTRTQAHMDLPSLRTAHKGAAAELILEPVVHLRFRYKQQGETPPRTAICAYRHFPCRGIHTWLEGDTSVVEAHAATLFAALGSMRCDLPRWPRPLPDHYRRTQKGPLEFCLGQGVDTQELKPIEQFLQAVQKEFEKLHGSIRPPADEPIQVILNNTANTHAEINPKAAEYHDDGAYWSLLDRRLFLTPLGRDSKTHGTVAGQFTLALFAARYGNDLPTWAYEGEGHLASMRYQTGHKAPYVTAEYKRETSPIDLRLSELEQYAEKDYGRYRRHGQIYVTLFRAGPSKYRGAYKKMLTELSETSDALGCVARNLLSLDQAELFKSALSFQKTRLRATHGK